MKDMRVRLSMLWVFAMFNYIYADVMSLMDPNVLKEVMTGSVGGIQITQGFMLGAAILMETAIAMIILSRILKYTANRWANIIFGVVHTAAVFVSMFLGTPPPHYLFFGIIEMACTLLIVYYAWKWPKQESQT